MKTVFYYLIIILSISSCKGQKKIVESKSKDIIVFEFEGNDVKSVKNKKYLITGVNTEIYNKNKIIIIIQKWLGYGTGHFDKIYSFAKKKDTMNIHCLCGQELNRYIKNIRFQKGDYKLRFENETIIKGSRIQVDNELKKTIFKNAYIREENSKVIKQVPFKELDFYKISLKDKGVIWKKLDEKK